MTHTIRAIGPDIWVAEQPAKVFGVNYGIRMTIIRLEDNKLAVISPITLTDALAMEVDSLGKVAYLIAPNSFHHLHMKPWTIHYQAAELFTVSHIVKKRPDLKPDIILDESTLSTPEKVPDPLATILTDLAAVYISGSKMYEEVVFFHKKSGTVILTDLCFNLQCEQGLFARLALKLYGVYKKFGPSKAVAIFIRNPSQISAAITKMNHWTYQRVIVAHGDISEDCAPTLVQDSLASLL